VKINNLKPNKIMKLKQILESVKEFQIASGQPVNEKPTNLTFEENRLRYDLMKEENTEYIVACDADDKIEILDALVDKMYILAGTINQHGFGDVFEEAFNRVHTNNMTKVVEGKVIRNPDGKILKPEGFQPVDLTDLIQ